MPYTLGQASKASGIPKPTLARAIKYGKISAGRNPDGTYAIEPAELHRVYPPVTASTSAMARQMLSLETMTETLVVQELRARLSDKDAMIADLRAERDRLLSIVEQREQRLLPAPSWWRRWRGR